MNEANIYGIEYNCSRDFYYQPNKVSEFEKKIYIKKANKLVKENEKIARKNLKKCKKELLLIANKINENKTLTRNEFINLLK